MFVATKHPETGLLSQIVDVAMGGPEKRERAALWAQHAEAARLKREALEQEISWMQQAAQQQGLGQAAEAAAGLQQLQHEQNLALEHQRQQGQTKILIGVAAVGLIGMTLWRRSKRRS